MMKTLLLFTSMLFATKTVKAQFDIIKKIESKTENRINKKIDKTIDKGLDKTEKGIDDAAKNEKNKKKTEETKTTAEPGLEKANTQTTTESKETSSVTSYGKYDFIQGDKIIFEDNFTDETLGEFPSKWKLLNGAAENIKAGEVPCLGFVQGSTNVAPLMGTENFLPKIFTLEFDIYFYENDNETYRVRFGNNDELVIWVSELRFDPFRGNTGFKFFKGWHHIAMAVNDKKMKVYFDETRVLNIPEIKFNIQKVVFSALSLETESGKPAMIKSVRIAEGGMDLYKRIMTDGKYIARGILFDVNKATLKPQSMGQINEMVKLMKEHPELKFSVEGHTDIDGDDASNQKLSEERALTVKTQMISMGIEDGRLGSKGFGESKPTNDNTSPEGKANNRRVEFIKK